MFGVYLKKYRINKNLTQQQFAEKIGTSQCYYSQLETGSIKPGFNLIHRIAKVMGVEEETLRNLL